MQPHQPPGWQPPPQQFGPAHGQAGTRAPTPPKGTAVAAAVLAFVVAALVMLATPLAWFNALIGLVVAALFVTGGVLLLLRKPAGRVLLMIAGGLQAAIGITLIIFAFVTGASYDNPLDDQRLYFGLGLVLFAAALLVLTLIGPTARYARGAPRTSAPMLAYPYPPYQQPMPQHPHQQQWPQQAWPPQQQPPQQHPPQQQGPQQQGPQQQQPPR